MKVFIVIAGVCLLLGLVYAAGPEPEGEGEGKPEGEGEGKPEGEGEGKPEGDGEGKPEGEGKDGASGEGRSERRQMIHKKLNMCKATGYRGKMMLRMKAGRAIKFAITGIDVRDICEIFPKSAMAAMDVIEDVFGEAEGEGEGEGRPEGKGEPEGEGEGEPEGEGEGEPESRSKRSARGMMGRKRQQEGKKGMMKFVDMMKKMSPMAQKRRRLQAKMKAYVILKKALATCHCAKAKRRKSIWVQHQQMKKMMSDRSSGSYEFGSKEGKPEGEGEGKPEGEGEGKPEGEGEGKPEGEGEGKPEGA